MNKLAKMKVEAIMTKTPVSVNQSATLLEVKNIIEQLNIHHVPVTDDKGIILGMISKSDILMLFDWNPDSNNAKFNTSNAFDFCTKKVFVIREDDYVLECYSLFKSNAIRSLPVVNKDGALTGIVTTMDLLHAAYDELLHDYEMVNQSKP
jgi:CBS domain-containing protein